MDSSSSLSVNAVSLFQCSHYSSSSLHVRVCGGAHVHGYTCVHVCGGQRLTGDVNLQVPPTMSSETGVLSVARNIITIRLVWLASEAQGSSLPGSTSPVLRLQVHIPPVLVIFPPWILETKSRSSGLQVKYLTN